MCLASVVGCKRDILSDLPKTRMAGSGGLRGGTFSSCICRSRHEYLEELHVVTERRTICRYRRIAGWLLPRRPCISGHAHCRQQGFPRGSQLTTLQFALHLRVPSEVSDQVRSHEAPRGILCGSVVSSLHAELAFPMFVEVSPCLWSCHSGLRTPKSHCITTTVRSVPVFLWRYNCHQEESAPSNISSSCLIYALSYVLYQVTTLPCTSPNQQHGPTNVQTNVHAIRLRYLVSASRLSRTVYCT